MGFVERHSVVEVALSSRNADLSYLREELCAGYYWVICSLDCLADSIDSNLAVSSRSYLGEATKIGAGVFRPSSPSPNDWIEEMTSTGRLYCFSDAKAISLRYVTMRSHRVSSALNNFLACSLRLIFVRAPKEEVGSDLTSSASGAGAC